MKKLIFILGPTATGKTDLAVKLADGIGEIISVDSMQVYKELNCGTAKPSKEQLKRVKHYLIDIVPPNYRFSAGDFRRMALESIELIYKRGKIPFLVGGTGLYFKALEKGLVDAPKADLKLRDELYGMEKESRGILYKKLCEIDPETAIRLHPNDLIRIVRALEIYYLTGITFSSFIKQENSPAFNILKIGINMERGKLYKRIENRCYKMIECGLANEVVSLLSRGYDERYPSMKGLGYSHFISYLKGCYSYKETVRIFIRDTRRFAKRQITWFKSDKDIIWFNPVQLDEIKEIVHDFISS